MKRATRIAVGLGIALSTALAATALSAHPSGYGPGWGMGGGMGWGPGPMMGYGHGPGGPGYGMGPGYGRGPGGDPAAFIEHRLAGLKSELKITPAQESVWNAYAEQAKQQADSMRNWMTTMREAPPATLPERLELRNQVWKQRQAQSEAMTQKTKDLYAALTSEQKPVADQLLGGFGTGMRGGPGYRPR